MRDQFLYSYNKTTEKMDVDKLAGTERVKLSIHVQPDSNK